MVRVKAISGEPEYIEVELGALLSDGWEIIDMSTSLYNASSGIRKETTVYLKRMASE